MTKFNIAYQVITKVDCEPEGNRYTPFAYKDGDKIVINDNLSSEEMRKLMDEKKCDVFTKVYAQVFTFAEIVIIDKDTGRELVGAQRKADKWYVEYREFDDIDKAVRFARRIYDKSLKERIG